MYASMPAHAYPHNVTWLAVPEKESIKQASTLYAKGLRTARADADAHAHADADADAEAYSTYLLTLLCLWKDGSSVWFLLIA